MSSYTYYKLACSENFKICTRRTGRVEVRESPLFRTFLQELNQEYHLWFLQACKKISKDWFRNYFYNFKIRTRIPSAIFPWILQRFFPSNLIGIPPRISLKIPTEIFLQMFSQALSMVLSGIPPRLLSAISLWFLSENLNTDKDCLKYFAKYFFSILHFLQRLQK